jgi:hypothetical protein
MCKNTGCFGSFIRIVLSLINIVFLLFGLSIFVCAALLKWADTSVLSRMVSNEEIRSIIDVSAIEHVSFVLLVLGAFIVVLSLVGLIGACCANRFFLVLYEIVLVLLFLSHGVLLIIGGIKSTEVEREFRHALNTTVEKIKHSRAFNHSSEEFNSMCNAFRLVSELFTCCGAGSPADFNKTLAAQCCIQPMPIYGCSDRAVSVVKRNGINIIIIPNSVILCFEFILILVVPFLIGRITKGRRNELEEEDRMINIKPTTYGGNYRD